MPSLLVHDFFRDRMRSKSQRLNNWTIPFHLNCHLTPLKISLGNVTKKNLTNFYTHLNSEKRENKINYSTAVDIKWSQIENGVNQFLRQNKIISISIISLRISQLIIHM